MGLLSGHNKNTNTVGGRKHGHHNMGTTNGGVSNHRYETRSRGGLFSRNNGPGTTTGTTNSTGLFSRNKGPGTTTGATNSTGMGMGNSTGRGFGNKHSRNNIGTGTGTGTGTGVGTVTGNGAMTSGGYSGSGVNNQGPPTHGHAHSTITKGKLENKFGKMVGSTNMRMKGAAKIEQGEAEKIAAGHLNDADRLENAAVQKRHMAGVGPGIHSTAGNVRGGLKH